MSDPIRDDLMICEGILGEALARVDHVLKQRPDLTAEQRYLAAFDVLHAAVTNAKTRLLDLNDRLPAVAARPPDAVLADIEAEGHTVWAIARFPGGCMRVETAINGPKQPSRTGPEAREEWDAYREAREQGDAWNMDDAASSADLAALLETRLADIRKLHADRAAAVAAVEADAASDAEAMLEGQSAAFRGRTVCYAKAPGVSWCGGQYEAISDRLEHVTCPACLVAFGRAEEAVATEEARRADQASERLDAIIDADDGVIDREEG